MIAIIKHRMVVKKDVKIIAIIVVNKAVVKEKKVAGMIGRLFLFVDRYVGYKL